MRLLFLTQFPLNFLKNAIEIFLDLTSCVKKYTHLFAMMIEKRSQNGQT